MSTPALIDNLLNYLDNPQPTADEAQKVFTPLTMGEYDDVHIAALLATLRTRGEKLEDILGAARAFINASRPFPVQGEGVLDTAGTGGDRSNTINISTGASLITAAGGCRVVKCGNRSVSSKSGSADVLEALNIPLDLDPDRAVRQVEASNFTFLFAPAYHPAIAHVMPVRRALKLPTIFNILGPILSPARPALQIMGIAKPELGPVIAEVFQQLGRERALVVHGSGVDEIAVHGPTDVWELNNGSIEHYQLTPESMGLSTHPLSALAGGDGAENAAIIRKIFSGHGTQAHNDALAASAGAMFYLHGAVPTIGDGAMKARELIADGTVAAWLKKHEDSDYGTH
ncbi:anthranilate phosphoribosyltransferase [Corynebacterium felinum]|uniref:Anthranilate phosphoribosyltransferase n=1 Tax=Corynebacterium felinum TaxID=131318 RepID=A0ABU2B6L2_9CORY|nr:anthranilate phosphoribosyltransferase [Corynebacterium felinum]MDF5819614.1 anthranilate phosphoribosyltransferase [Corynebacterium felinum]MDR7354255.1 anthranilate phosphoribosyltransferase [Corynebacterium felinum]WJY96423.1 Bifunctional protein TrpGD [Corynebacterium felinum]